MKANGHKNWCDYPSGPCDCGKDSAEKSNSGYKAIEAENKILKDGIKEMETHLRMTRRISPEINKLGTVLLDIIAKIRREIK